MSKIKESLSLIWKEFIYGGHFQSLGAVGIVFISAILLKIDITWDVLFVTYLLIYPSYLYNRFVEIKIDYLTNPGRTEYLKSYISYTPLIVFLVISILIGSLIYFSNFWALIFGLLLLLFSFLYTIFFKKLTKKIVFLKNLYVSTAFSFFVFFLIVYYAYHWTSTLIIGVFILMIFVYFKTFVMQIFLDVKDTETDKKEGLLTFPIILGKEKTFNILKIFSILATVPIPIIFSLYFNIFPKSVLMLLLVVPFNFYCFKLSRQQNYFGYILASGEFILWPILILIGKILL